MSPMLEALRTGQPLPDKAAALAHYTAQAALCDASTIAALIRKMPLTLADLTTLVNAVACAADALYRAEPDLMGLDDASEMLDSAAIRLQDGIEVVTFADAVHGVRA